MISTFFYLLVLPFLLNTGSGKCEGVKTGTFKLTNKEGSEYLITRTENKQQEHVLKTGLVSEFNLEWTSDCEYILYNRRVLKGQDNLPPEVNSDTLYNKITSVKGSRHKVVSSMKRFKGTVTSTLVRQ